MSEADKEKVSSYEEAFEKIKEETGVNSMHVSILVEMKLYSTGEF
jgi:hypothetical protein